MRTSIRLNTRDWKSIVSTCLLVLAWLRINISSLEWLLRSFQHASAFNLIIISLVVVVLVTQVVRYRRQLEVSITPQLRLCPLLLMLGSAVGLIAWQWFVDIKQIAVILSAIGTYGLCGLFMQPVIWRQGLPVAALVACILPFCTQFGTGIGFPVRVLTARIVEQILSTWQITAVSSYDIIVLENGIAHVDLPCSGLRSLWTGTLFLLATTWLENRQIGARWLLIYALSLFSQVIANIIRVLTLVVITYVFQETTSAQILHVPLGLLGFICACGLTWLLLQSVPKNRQVLTIVEGQETEKPNRKLSFSIQMLLAVVITLALIPQPQHQQKPLLVNSWNWPSALVSERIPLTAAEQNFFNNATSTIPEKRSFKFGELSGSLLLVTSTAWSSYHPPELCFVGSGMKVDRTERKQLTPQVKARWLSLQNSKLSATYWFQSPRQTTDDFLSRLWSQITSRDQTWVMVSVLFDSAKSPGSPAIRDFAATIYDVIRHSLNGGRL